MAEFEELKSILRSLLTNRFAPKPAYTRGLLGDGQGNVQVPDKPDHNYVRFNRGSTEFFEIFNRTVNPVDGWPVLIGELPWQPGLTQIVDTDWSAYEQSGWGDNIGATTAHAPTHEWPDGSPGSDPVNVHMRSIVPGRAYTIGTGSTTVFVNAFDYQYKGSGTSWTGLPGFDLAPVMSSMSTGNARLMGLYLDPASQSLAIITGSQSVFTTAFDPPTPAFPAQVLPLANIRVYGGQSSLAETDIRDKRQIFSLVNDGRGEYGDGGEARGKDRTLGNTDNFDLGFITNNVDRLHIQNDGKVGIGTQTPTIQTEIQNNQNASTILGVRNTSTGTSASARILMSNDSGAITNAAGLILGGVNYTGVVGWDDRFIFNAGVLVSNGLLIRAATGGIGFSSSGGTNAESFFDTSGNLGIGTSSPDGKLHVHTATAGSVTPSVGADDLIVENSGNAGITILSPNANVSDLAFGSPAKANSGLLRWSSTAGVFSLGTNIAGASLRFLTAAFSEAVRITSSGDVGINTTSPDTTLQVVGDVKFGDDNTNYVEISTVGDTKFVGEAGLIFGEIYGYDTNTTITISGSGIANKVQIDAFDTDGLYNGMTPDHTNDHITVDLAGVYMCTVSSTIESVAGAASKMGMAVYKNNGATLFQNLHVHRSLSGGGSDVGSLSLSGIIILAATDTVEVWVWNETNTQNYVVDDITLSLHMLGGVNSGTPA